MDVNYGSTTRAASFRRAGGPLGRSSPLILLLALLGSAFARPTQAQVMDLASLDWLNHRLAGCVVDYTHNHGGDRRLFSPILGMPRDLYVYLPPGYSRASAYPLIIYLHTATVDEHVFVGTNFLVQLDQMIQRGEFPPVVVACPDGGISGENWLSYKHSFYVNGDGGRFQDHLVQEVAPFLMQFYSIRPERQAHAVLGLSAGGFGALGLGLKYRSFFGAVATLAGPANMRYCTCSGDCLAPFDPATFRWTEGYNPNQVVGRFFFGLRPVRAKKYAEPIFGSGPMVHERLIGENPADLLFSTDLQPGELDIYLNVPGRDNYNFDDQGRSFAWLAAQKGVHVTLEVDPKGRHNLPYFRNNHAPAYRWLSQRLLPPLPLVAPVPVSVPVPAGG